MVQSAPGDSIIIGRGTVFLSIDGKINVKGYHAPQFSSNINSVSSLSSLYGTLLAEHHFKHENKSVCVIKKRKTDEVVLVNPESNVYKPDLVSTDSMWPLSDKQDIVRVSCPICANSSMNFDGRLGTMSEWHKRFDYASPS